ncbi:MAG: protein-glutamine gamma-glutamyltransferase [Paenibacillaceae bacterium]|nr:protein-glutamine gamma-glutamyltransferase [Paenibacillaceae bacterium]
MIVIRGEMLVQPPYGLNGKELSIFHMKQAQATVYHYASVEELRFELNNRSLMTQAAVELNASGVQFAPFNDSRCNPMYWRRDERGGFRLLPAIPPAEGIRDIYRQGPLYAFECATAMVIVLYKGMLGSLGDTLFNLWFGGLLLYDWHYDQDLHLVDSKKPQDAVPGDVQYFINPDVAPEFQEWQGENVVRLEEDLYYGHGIGLKPAEKIIESLNGKRKPYSQISAYLTDIVVHPDYPVLYRTLIGGGPAGTASPPVQARSEAAFVPALHLQTGDSPAGRPSMDSGILQARIGGRTYVTG